MYSLTILNYIKSLDEEMVHC